MRYKVELIKSDDGYTIGCPELPGCWSQGRTEEEAISNIRDAIQEYLSVQPMADSQGKVAFVDVKDVVMPLLSFEAKEKNGCATAVEPKSFDFGPLELNLPAEWTSHKVEDLLDILEGSNRR
jgi:predicted RNase H-like HicB family nuclease